MIETQRLISNGVTTINNGSRFTNKHNADFRLAVIIGTNWYKFWHYKFLDFCRFSTNTANIFIIKLECGFNVRILFEKILEDKKKKLGTILLWITFIIKIGLGKIVNEVFHELFTLFILPSLADRNKYIFDEFCEYLSFLWRTSLIQLIKNICSKGINSIQRLYRWI